MPVPSYKFSHFPMSIGNLGKDFFNLMVNRTYSLVGWVEPTLPL